MDHRNMFYLLIDRQASGSSRAYRINTSLVAYVSTGEEGLESPLNVEIGFSGGAVLNLTVAERDWNQFRSIIENKDQA
jgi:hypothetical protein